MLDEPIYIYLYLFIPIDHPRLKIVVREHKIKQNQINPGHKCYIPPSQHRPCQTVGRIHSTIDLLFSGVQLLMLGRKSSSVPWISIYTNIRWMEEILHQLMVYPIIYRVSTIQGGAGFLPSTVCLYMYNTIPLFICFVAAPIFPWPLPGFWKCFLGP